METKITTESKNKEVVITDIKMPFSSMVVFMIKWMFASIPAIIIFYIIMVLTAGIFSGIINGLR